MSPKDFAHMALLDSLLWLKPFFHNYLLTTRRPFVFPSWHLGNPFWDFLKSKLGHPTPPCPYPYLAVEESGFIATVDGKPLFLGIYIKIESCKGFLHSARHPPSTVFT